MRAIWLIARTVLVEAIRRREIYVIVLVSVSIIMLTGGMRFFGMEGMNKFYREMSMLIMNLATALAVIVLGARQLPREFERRTIYPLLAKPVSRSAFLLGKFLGVVLSGLFCYLLFILVFFLGMLYLHAKINPVLFLQTVYLQCLALTLVASMAFMLSLLFSVDASITISLLMYGLGGTISSIIDYTYDMVKVYGTFVIPWLDGNRYQTSVGELLMLLLNYGIPQLSLFDLSSKLVHEDTWGPVPVQVLGILTLYAGCFILVFLGVAYFLFRRRAL